MEEKQSPKQTSAIIAEVNQLYKELQDKHGPRRINLIIRDVTDLLTDKVAEAKAQGMDEDAYTQLVSNTIIQPYQVLNLLLVQMMSGTGAYLNTFAKDTQDFPLSEVYKTIAVVEEKLELDDTQCATLNQTRRILERAMAVLEKNNVAGISPNINWRKIRGIILTVLLWGALIAFWVYIFSTCDLY